MAKMEDPDEYALFWLDLEQSRTPSNGGSELTDPLKYDEVKKDYINQLLSVGELVTKSVANKTTYGMEFTNFLILEDNAYERELAWAYKAANNLASGTLIGSKLGEAEAKCRVLSGPLLSTDGKFRNIQINKVTEYSIFHPHPQDLEMLRAIRGLLYITALVENAIPLEGRLNVGGFYYQENPEMKGKWDRILKTVRSHLVEASSKYALKFTGEMYNHILYRIYDSLLKTEEFPKDADKQALEEFMQRNLLDHYFIAEADQPNLPKNR